MTTFYLVRHGETEWNVQQRLQGWLDSALTERGKQQALCLREALLHIDFDVVVTSSSGRALETAKLLTCGRACDIVTDDDLREIYLGNWQGMLIADILLSEDRDSYLAYSTAPATYQAQYTESFEQVTRRAMTVLQQLAKRFPNGNVLIVSHGVTLKCIVNAVLGVEVAHFWTSTSMESTSVTELFVEGNEWRVGKMGSTAHLHGNG